MKLEQRFLSVLIAALANGLDQDYWDVVVDSSYGHEAATDILSYVEVYETTRGREYTLSEKYEEMLVDKYLTG